MSNEEGGTAWVPVHIVLGDDEVKEFFGIHFYLPDTMQGDEQKQEELMKVFNFTFAKYCDIVGVEKERFIENGNN